MTQARAPILIKSFDDVGSKLHSLKADDILVLDTVTRGQKANQSLASFAKQNDFPLHTVRDAQYCRDNIDALRTAGTRIVLRVDALGCFDNQCKCSFSDNAIFTGVMFLISNAMGADDTWIGKTVQATVKHSQSTDKGYLINCTFVKRVPTPAEGSQKLAKSTAVAHRPANLRAADEHIFAQQRQDEQDRQLRGEAAEYNLDIDLLLRLKEVGITEPDDLHLYSRYKHFLEQDYNVHTLKRDYPEVHAMWAFTALQEVRDRDAYQGYSSFHPILRRDCFQLDSVMLFVEAVELLQDASLPAWVPAYYMKDTSLCTIHNARGTLGYGGPCVSTRCTFAARCMLCDGPHGIFHQQPNGAWKCKDYRKYRAQLDKLQDKGGWTLPNSLPIKEAHLQELFKPVPFTMLEAVNELRAAKLRTKYEAAQANLATANRIKARIEQGLSADRKRMDEAEKIGSALLKEVEEDDYFYLIAEGNEQESKAGSDCDTYGDGDDVPATQAAPVTPIHYSELMKLLTKSSQAPPPAPVLRSASPYAAPQLPEPPLPPPPPLVSRLALPAQLPVPTVAPTAPPASTAWSALLQAAETDAVPPLPPLFPVPAVAPVASQFAWEELLQVAAAAPRTSPLTFPAYQIPAQASFTSVFPVPAACFEQPTPSPATSVDDTSATPSTYAHTTDHEHRSAPGPEDESEPFPEYAYAIGAFDELLFRLDHNDRYTSGTEVYRARLRSKLTGAQREVAVKVFPKYRQVRGFKTAVEKELNAMDQLSSLHTVKYIGSAEVRYPDIKGKT
jgi:hypothetical protein